MGQQLALALTLAGHLQVQEPEAPRVPVPPGWEIVSARRVGRNGYVHLRPPGARPAAVKVAPPSPPPAEPEPLSRDEERALTTIQAFAEHGEQRSLDFLRRNRLPFPERAPR